MRRAKTLGLFELAPMYPPQNNLQSGILKVCVAATMHIVANTAMPTSSQGKEKSLTTGMVHIDNSLHLSIIFLLFIGLTVAQSQLVLNVELIKV